MRASFVFSEVLTGLRRNVTMTIAMILTTAISLSLLGGGLLIVRLIDKMHDIYYDKIEVSINLTKDVSANDQKCTQQPCTSIRSSLENNPGVESVVFEDRNRAYQRFKEIFEAEPELVKLARKEALPASFHVKLVDPSRSDVIVKSYSGQPGVRAVNDQGVFLERFFGVLNGVRDATFAVALVQALAALLLISNTIQVSAYTRRTEVGIMRLVGATRWYTQLPFLLEAVVAGLIGAGLAIGGLILAKVTFLDRVLAAPISSGIVPPVNMLDILLVTPWLLLVSILISAITGYVTLRLYVRH
ncbi:MAG: FtsX-like permease family protein [Pseudonocardiaceae bacterium]|nr:FtsX-like permease family protein [Pseudonocardiaceae bacterium]